MNKEESREELIQKIKFNEKSRRKMQKSLMQQIEELQQKVKELETNRDELKKWLENHWEQSQDIWFVKVLNKIAELERGKE